MGARMWESHFPQIKNLSWLGTALRLNRGWRVLSGGSMPWWSSRSFSRFGWRRCIQYKVRRLDWLLILELESPFSTSLEYINLHVTWSATSETGQFQCTNASQELYTGSWAAMRYYLDHWARKLRKGLVLYHLWERVALSFATLHLHQMFSDGLASSLISAANLEAKQRMPCRLKASENQ